MKKFIAVAVIGLFTVFTANAAGHIGQCIYPKTKVAKNGYLEFGDHVYIWGIPDASKTKQLMTSMQAFTIKAETNGYIQLVTVPDYTKPDPDKDAGKIAGWAKLSDFEAVAIRNCT
jgi:hypothetical protein